MYLTGLYSLFDEVGWSSDAWGFSNSIYKVENDWVSRGQITGFDTDYYQITLPYSGDFKVTISNDSSNNWGTTWSTGFIYAEVVNSSGAIQAGLASSAYASSDGVLSLTWGGSYSTSFYLKVYGYSSGSYVVKLQDNYFVDITVPTVSTFSPADEATGIAIGSNIVVTFSEAIARGVGNIVLKTAAGATVATYDAATSSNLSLSGSTLTINPTADLGYSTGYKVEIAAGSIKDIAGNNYAGTASYNFTTVAGTGNQTLTGTPGPDMFTSRPGNDTIDGGAGIDTVAFPSNLANYTLTKSGSTYTVRAKTGTDGTDTLTNVESLKFTDLSVNLQVKGTAAAAPLADVQRISELYVAFFNRTPDADGLAYWIGQKVAGQSINQISESFYNVGASSTFSGLTGFSTSMSNADFLNVFYKNVLGRPEGADAGGLAYWNGKLADGSSTRSSLANDILTSAHTFKGNPTWGFVADLLDNKIAVANTIAVQWGLTYNTDAYARGVAIAAAITPTDTTVALALVGVSAADLNIA